MKSRRKQFAILYPAAEKKNIPVKLKLLHRTPDTLLDWYINRFNPWHTEPADFLGEEGHLVQLAFTRAEHIQNPERTSLLLSKTVDALLEMETEVFTLPDYLSVDLPRNSVITDGRFLFAFLILSAIERALKLTGRSLKRAEIAVIEGSRDLTFCLLNQLYAHVNFLNLLVDDPAEPLYQTWASEIFSETGLNLGIHEKNKILLQSADIVINTCTPAIPADHAYARNSIYIDLGKNEAHRMELRSKRPDMLILDGMLIHTDDKKIPLSWAEAAFFEKSSSFRRIIKRGFQQDTADQVHQEIHQLPLSPAGLSFQNREIQGFRRQGDPLPEN